MGVYIKGMDMTKRKPGAYSLVIRLFIRKNGTASIWGITEYIPHEPLDLIHVPPHGDLIEKHDVFRLISAFPEIDKLLTVQFMQALYNLPTIIPAESKEAQL